MTFDEYVEGVTARWPQFKVELQELCGRCVGDKGVAKRSVKAFLEMKRQEGLIKQ